MQFDVITIEGEAQQGEPLIKPVMRAGRRVQAAEPLAVLRERSARERTRLPAHLRALGTQPLYPVSSARSVLALAKQADEERRKRRSS